jgi:hypothetical protein
MSEKIEKIEMIINSTIKMIQEGGGSTIDADMEMLLDMINGLSGQLLLNGDTTKSHYEEIIIDMLLNDESKLCDVGIKLIARKFSNEKILNMLNAAIKGHLPKTKIPMIFGLLSKKIIDIPILHKLHTMYKEVHGDEHLKGMLRFWIFDLQSQTWGATQD